MARTGFGSRFLLGGRQMGLFARFWLTFFVSLFALGMCFVGAVSGSRGLQEALDPDAVMYRLSKPWNATPRTGAFRTAAPLFAEGSTDPPICDVVHEHYVSGKNGGWRVDQRFARSAGATFLGQRILAGQPVVFDPIDPVVVGTEREYWLRSVLPGVLEGGRLSAHCVANGERVFVEGCMDAGYITSCNDVPLTVTTGDGTAQPRIDAHASRVAGMLAGGAAVLVGLLAYLWWLARARPLAEALLRRAKTPTAFTELPLVGAIVGAAALAALAQGIMVWTAPVGSAASRGRGGYLLGIFVVAVAATLAVVVRHRRRLLDRAMAPVREAETVPLRDARGGVVELAVNVRDDGAPVTGVLDARPHAWVEVRLEEMYVAGKTQLTRLVKRAAWPERVPVRDASGDGWIDLTHAEIDLRSRVKILRGAAGNATLQALARTPFGAVHPPGATHLGWIVEESVLDPGESLYVLGQCQRVEDPQAVGSYRADATVAVVGGSADARIIVHAGSERSLLRSLGVERGYLTVLLAALVGATAALTATMIGLWAL